MSSACKTWSHACMSSITSCSTQSYPPSAPCNQPCLHLVSSLRTSTQPVLRGGGIDKFLARAGVIITYINLFTVQHLQTNLSAIFTYMWYWVSVFSEFRLHSNNHTSPKGLREHVTVVGPNDADISREKSHFSLDLIRHASYTLLKGCEEKVITLAVHSTFYNYTFQLVH